MVTQSPDQGSAQTGDSAAPTATQPQPQRRSGRGQRSGRGPRPPAPPLASPRDIEAIIVDGDAQRLVRKAEEIGRRLREPLRAAHLRSIYAALRLIEAEWQGAAAGSSDVGRRLTHLRPQIAYLAAKHRTSIGPLRPVLEMSIGRIESDGARLVRLVDFVTAILAYHRAAGGEVKAASS